MNIGIVTTWFERGAAYVSRQYRDVLETQHNVYIYARGGESYAVGNPAWDNERVTWGKKSHIPIPMAIELEDFKNWILQNRLDIVLFNEQQWWEPIMLCNRLGIITGGYVDYYTEETIPLFGCYDFLVCNTRRHYSVFDWHPQAFYVHWGTDITLFSPMTFAPVQSGFVTFFHSCGVSPDRKGTDLVIQAFAQLHGPARLVLHAQQNLKEFYPQLKGMIEDLECSGRLVCYEETVPAPGLYHLGDVYVYPSRLDGIGLTIAEAMACGLPVITSDYPPMNEFIDGSNGLLVNIALMYARADGYYWPQCDVDLDHLRECMQKYIDQRNQLTEFKQAARTYAEKHLDWSKNGMDLPAMFSRVVRRSSEEKYYAEQQVKVYEHKRMSLEHQLYQQFPRLFKILRLIWLIVKRWI